MQVIFLTVRQMPVTVQWPFSKFQDYAVVDNCKQERIFGTTQTKCLLRLPVTVQPAWRFSRSSSAKKGLTQSLIVSNLSWTTL